MNLGDVNLGDTRLGNVNMNFDRFGNMSTNNINNNNYYHHHHHHHHHQYLASTNLPLVQEQQQLQQQQQKQQQLQQQQQPQTLQQLCDRVQSLDQQQTRLLQQADQLQQQLQLPQPHPQPQPQPLVGASLPSAGPAPASSAPSSKKLRKRGGRKRSRRTTPKREGRVTCECGDTFKENYLNTHRKRGCRLREKEEKPQCRYCFKRFGSLDYINGVHKRSCPVQKAQRDQQFQAAWEAAVSSGTGSSSGSPPGFFASRPQLVASDGLLPFSMNSQQAGAAPQTLAATLAPQQEQQQQQQQNWPQPEPLQYVTGPLDMGSSNLNTNYMADLTNGMGVDMNFAPYAFPDPSNANVGESTTDSQFIINDAASIDINMADSDPEMDPNTNWAPSDVPDPSNAIESTTDPQLPINPALPALAQSLEATAAAVLPAAQPADLNPGGPTDEVDQVQVQAQTHDESDADKEYDDLFDDLFGGDTVPSPTPTPTAPPTLWLPTPMPNPSISQTQSEA
ncbi:hypothetical protein QBC37DRAFT_372377 [Rhypophila decipiens]|uniref:Uncharacterized protein n=1 Tax=Rhypophila decipiens TaxID=261697 RepID=A0AAN6Y9C9_9PEZI|nr:hypothetical protein QBC37DRAFT_372377 [Rhypophila decipiens]